VWKKITIVAAILSGILLGLVAGLTSDRVADNIRLRLASFAHTRLGLTVEHLPSRR
jgi:hypothetical protein